MGIKKITLTEEHIKLIQNIKFEAFDFGDGEKDWHYGWGIDQWSLFGGTYVMQDIALILGHFNDNIKGTEESPMGRQYPKELEEHFWQLYDDIASNMEYIISLIFYYLDKGGLTPGTYKCQTELKNWTKTEEIS